MNFLISSSRRAIAAQILSSSISSPKCLIPLYSNAILQQYSLYSTTPITGGKKKNHQLQKSNPKQLKTQDPVEQSPPPSSFHQEIQKKTSSVSVNWPRPSEIPWQAKVANSVNLIGRLEMPVQFQASPDGKYWAATIIAQQHSISLRIPLIFEGDLAHIAACHLKEKDCVYIDGQLSADPPPFTLNCGQSSFQVLVHNINFVEGFSLPKKSFSNHKISVRLENVKNNTCLQKESQYDDYQSKESVKDDTFLKKESVEEDISVDQSLIDLITKPNEWWDTRLKQGNSTSSAFEHKVDGKLVWINESTPDWITKKLECLQFDHKVDTKSLKVTATKDGDLILNSWRDLLENPKQWRDHRENKLKGLVSPKHPDFKNKDSGIGIWLNRAPKFVLPELEVLEFDVPFQKMKKADDDSWKDLVENPKKWWDNRSHKINKKSPDFKHKDSGKALWLVDSPSWALSKLPPLKAQPN